MTAIVMRDQCYRRYLSNWVNYDIITGGGEVQLMTLLATMCCLSLRGERERCYPQMFIHFVFVRFLAPLLLCLFVIVVCYLLSIAHCLLVVGLVVSVIEIKNLK